MPEWIGPYEILDELGRGGMGRVYRARDTRHGRIVALKALRDELSDNPRLVQRFEREAHILKRLDHPNIVRLYDWGSENDMRYIAMALVEGETLHERRTRAGALSAAEVCSIALAVASALEATHRRGIVHRDVKSSNILLGKDGSIRVTDFGVARDVESATITQRDEVLGSLPYMSPEATEAGDTDARSDMYSLGIVMYEALGGRLPFPGPTAAAFIMQHLHTPPDLAAIEPRSVPLARVIARLLAKRPDDRYQSAGDLVKALEAIVPVADRESLETVVGSRGLPESDEKTEVAARPPAEERVADRNGLRPVVGGVLALAIVSALIALIALIALMFWPGDDGETTSTGDATATAVALAFAQALATQQASGAAPGGSNTALVARVAPDICANQRETASTGARIVQCVVEGERVVVQRGPEASEGRAWWFVSAPDGRPGWIAEEFLLLSIGTVPVGRADSNDATTLLIEGIDILPDGGIAVRLIITNQTSVPLPRASESGSTNIFLTDDQQRQIPSAEAGGGLAHGTPAEIAPGGRISGWHRFALPDAAYRGALTLHYPAHEDITFDFALP